MDLDQKQSAQLQLFIQKLNEVTGSLSALARDVQKDAEELAELRTELKATAVNFADLAKLVRNGGGKTILHRLTTLEVKLDDLLKSTEERKKSARTVLIVLLAAVLGASLPFVLDLINVVLQHVLT